MPGCLLCPALPLYPTAAAAATDSSRHLLGLPSLGGQNGFPIFSGINVTGGLLPNGQFFDIVGQIFKVPRPARRCRYSQRSGTGSMHFAS